MSLQFELLSTVAQEIQGMKVQLGQLVANFAAKQDLAGGLVSTSQAPCGICRSHTCGQHMQHGDLEESQTFSKDESQLP